MKTYLIVLCLVLVALSAQGQLSKDYIIKDREQFFLLDYAVFKADSADLYQIEIYYQIYNAALNFNPMDDGSYLAKYGVTLELTKDDKTIDNFNQSSKVTVDSKEKAISSYDYRTNLVRFLVPEGKYELKAYLEDPASRTIVTKNEKIKVNNENGKRPFLSDIELVQMVKPVTDEPTVFDRGELLMVPSVSHTYGSSSDEPLKLFFYFEINQGREIVENARVETSLRNFTRGLIYRDSMTVDFKEGPIRQFREINIDDFHSGKYELIITLKNKKNKKIDVKSKDFELVWTQYSLLKNDYGTLVAQIALVASNEEVALLKKQETYEDRVAAFTNYWANHDPTPGTAENEAKKEFYRRIRIANDNFSFLYSNGWKTDRGRIYIVFGEPDQIDDYPIVSGSHPYQEWHYYRYTRYRKFVFMDINEDGDYRLTYPYDGLFQRPDF